MRRTCRLVYPTASRYQILCRRLVRERLYTFLCLSLATKPPNLQLYRILQTI